PSTRHQHGEVGRPCRALHQALLLPLPVRVDLHQTVQEEYERIELGLGRRSLTGCWFVVAHAIIECLDVLGAPRRGSAGLRLRAPGMTEKKRKHTEERKQ